MSQTAADRDSADFVPLMEAKQLTLLVPNESPFPNITFRYSQGHTTALQHPVISDGTITIYYCADLFPTALHIHVPWVMAYDIRPLETIAEKKVILAEAARDQWIMVFEHCPHVAAARVTAAENGYRIA